MTFLRRKRKVDERRDSGSYTFTDLAQMVVTGVKVVYWMNNLDQVICSLKVGREWQNKTKNAEVEEGDADDDASNHVEQDNIVAVDQDSDDTGIVL